MSALSLPNEGQFSMHGAAEKRALHIELVKAFLSG